MKKEQLTKKVLQELDQSYDSFFSDIYNELNIVKYRPIRDAISLVMRKFESNDHPLSYIGKFVMYIQANVVFQQLHLTANQRKLLQSLSYQIKHINLNYVYIGRITDFCQFTNI